MITPVWKCSHSEFFWSIFSRILTKYREIRSISPYSVWMRRNTDQKNSEYGHFTNSDLYRYLQDLVLMIFYWFWMLRTQSWNLGDVHPSSIGIWKSRVKKPNYGLWRHKTEFHSVQGFFCFVFLFCLFSLISEAYFELCQTYLNRAFFEILKTVNDL